MGIDLRLLPIECESHSLCYSHTLLDCVRNYELHEVIKKLEVVPIMRKITCFLATNNDGEPSYGDITQDAYGKDLTYVTSDLLSSINDEHVNGRNVAVWAYLKSLQPNTKVVLYWS